MAASTPVYEAGSVSKAREACRAVGGGREKGIHSILIPRIYCGGIAVHSSGSLGERAHYWEFNYLWRRGCVWHVIWCGDQRHVAHQPRGRRLVTDARRPLCPFILIEPALITWPLPARPPSSPLPTFLNFCAVKSHCRLPFNRTPRLYLVCVPSWVS